MSFEGEGGVPNLPNNGENLEGEVLNPEVDYANAHVLSRPDASLTEGLHQEEVEEPAHSSKSFEWPDRIEREEYTIDAFIPEINELLKNNQFVVVQAETGAGKTTHLPAGLALLNPDTPVTVTQPRRTAARWNSKRVATEMGQKLGDKVGLVLAREEAQVSRETQIIFKIDQSLLNTICRNKRLPEGIIMVDEAHERSVQIDILLALLKLYKDTSKDTKVIITSATIDTDKFSQYFGDAPIVNAPGRLYPVRREEPTELMQYEHHTEAVVRSVKDVMLRFRRNLGLEGEAKQHNKKLTIPSNDGSAEIVVEKGSISVILAGKEDISQVIRSINAYAQQLGLGDVVMAIPCHGESTPQEHDAVQVRVPHGKLRFVCGTEILGTGVTVPDTIGVIDSLQVKRRMTNSHGVGHLAKVAISRATVEQHAGRAGREQGGFYIPVSFGNEYNNLKPYPDPAILQEPLTSVVLQIAAIGESIRELELLDRPDNQKINVAIQSLQQIGALDQEEHITDLGEKLLSFSLSPERGVVLLAAEKYGILPEAVIATSVLEAEGIYDRARLPKDTTITDVPISEALAHRIAAHATKHEYQSENGMKTRWDVAANRVATYRPKEVTLPSWITQDGEDYYLEISHPEFPKADLNWLTEISRKVWSDKTGNDFVGIINAYRTFVSQVSRTIQLGRDKGMTRRETENHIRAWVDVHGMNYKRLHQAQTTIEEVTDELYTANMPLQESVRQVRAYDPDLLTKALMAGLLDNIGFYNQYGHYESSLLDNDTFDIHKYSACENPEVVFVGSVQKITGTDSRGRNYYKHIAETATAIQPEWFLEVAPQLSRLILYSDYQYDQTNDTVSHTQDLKFKDRNVGRKRVEADKPAELRKAFCAWMVSVMTASPRENIQVIHSGEQKKVQLSQILEANKAIVEEATLLNLRAGEEVFANYSKEKLQAWLEERVNEATNLATLPDLEVLRLPPLDADLRDLVFLENPDTFEFMGQTLKVSYWSNRLPQAELVDRDNQVWPNLPDEGVRLPSGRLVQLKVEIETPEGGYIVSGQDIPDLKMRVRDQFAKSQWEQWKKSDDKPEITLPSPVDGFSEKPSIIEHKYGEILGDKPLIAYGTIQTWSTRGYEAGRTFTPAWFYTRQEAEDTRRATITKLEELRSDLEEMQMAKEELTKLVLQIEDLDAWFKATQDPLPMMSRQLSSWLSEYGQAHENLANLEKARAYLKSARNFIQPANEFKERYIQEFMVKVAADAPRKSQRIQILTGRENEEIIFAMPDPADDGVWKMYAPHFLDNRFTNLDSDPWIIVKYKGWRSLSTGKDPRELVNNYLGGDHYDKERAYALQRLPQQKPPAAALKPVTVDMSKLENNPQLDKKALEEARIVVEEKLGRKNETLALAAEQIGRSVYARFGEEGLDDAYKELEKLLKYQAHGVASELKRQILPQLDGTLYKLLANGTNKEAWAVIEACLGWIEVRYPVEPEDEETQEEGEQAQEGSEVSKEDLQALRDRLQNNKLW